MKPILYSHGETSFTNNGLGRLADCISCVVTEERNGIYECQFTYPVTGEMYSRIQIGCILGVIHDDAKDMQPFDIYGKDAPLNGVVTFYAHHISYRLGHVILKPFSASSITDAFAAFPNKTYNSCPFTFWTDKSVSATWKVEVPSAVKAVLGGVEGSILDIYGKGEYEWDKFAVKLHLNRGNDNGVSIRYGVNLSDLDQSLDMSENYNSVAPYWMSVDGTLVTLPEGFITASSVQTGEEIIPVPLDLSSKFEDQPTVEQLRTEAQRQLDNSEAWIPNENISVKFIDLAHTQEYKDIAALQHVRLCDKVSVYCGPLGVNVVKMQIIKTVYNVLLEEYDEIELGTAKTSFADTLMARVSDVTGDLPTSTEVKTMLRQAVDDATDQITGAQNSHVRFIYDANGSLQEIVILDTDDITTATKIWRWNSGGLGYSSNGYSGPYSLAMTQNGAIVADFITTGTLNANLITAGTMSAERIFGGTLTLGGANNANGVLTIKDASNNIIGTWNNTGLTLNKGSIAGPSITLGGNNNADGTLAVKDASGNTIGTWNKDGISIYKGSITGGTINGALLTLGGANNGSGTLIVKDASNNTIGTWDNSGLTLNKGSIAGPSITLGGSSNTNGTLTVKNASGTTIGTWNKDGINVTSGSITGGTINGASLTLGGNGNVSGALTVNNANGSKVVELNNGGITVYKGNTKQFYVDSSGNATFAGSLNAATGTFKGELSAATGTFAGTMSAACITSGTMNAARISGGTLTLGGNNNGNGQLVVNNASGTKVVELNNGGITVYKGSTKQLYIDSSGNATFAGSLNAATGTFKGELSAATGSFKGELSAATGTFAGTMSAACITSGTLQLGSSYWNASSGIYLNAGAISLHSTDDWGFYVGPYGDLAIGKKPSDLSSFNNRCPFQVNNGGTVKAREIQFYDANNSTSNFSKYGSIKILFASSGNTDTGIELHSPNSGQQLRVYDGGVKIWNALTVSGTKSRVVSTNQYSDRLLYCYETPSPLFGDVGEGVIGDDGLCYVNIDPIFAQTITTDNYQVFLQRYGEGDCYVRERKGGWFVVAGTPGLAFGWEIKGKQSDYNQLRLNRNDETFIVPTQTYGEDAANHIGDIRKERDAA